VLPWGLLGLATQFFSDEQMERLRSYPDIGREELIRFFTLTRKDLGFVDNLERGGGRGPAARLGLAVQLCTLPWLGFVPDDLWSVPQAAVLRLADQLAVFPGVLGQYGRRAQTRSDHLKLVLRYLDWKPVPAGGEPLKDLEQFLQDRAMEHDTPSLLFHQAAEFLVSAHVVRPGVVTLMEMVATARTGAGALTSERVGHLLTGQMRGDLDRLLAHDAGLGMTRLTWLTTPAVEATSAAVKTAIEKLRFLRGMDAHHLDLSMLPRERRRFLATLGRRSTVQGLERRGERRFPILLALVAQSAVEQLDEVIALFDQAVPARESRAKARTDEALAERARKGEARQGGPGTADLMDAVEILKDLNRAGGRKVPAGSPVSFVPARYADYLARARKGGDETAFRHYWEMCTVLALRDGLRSGDVFVPGSRRYADPGTCLFTPEQWQPRLAEFCQLVRKPPGAAEAIAQVKDELHLALTDLEETLASSSPGDVGAVRLDSDGKLVIPPLSAEDIPAEARALRDELSSMLPFVPIASLLIELDARTNFLACFTHAGAASPPSRWSSSATSSRCSSPGPPTSGSPACPRRAASPTTPWPGRRNGTCGRTRSATPAP
jgi:hypothetical protein